MLCVLRLYGRVATVERELLLLVVLRYVVLLILILVKKFPPGTDLRNKDLRYRPP